MKVPGGIEAMIAFGLVTLALGSAGLFVSKHRIPPPEADVAGQGAIGGTVILLALARRHSLRETFSLRWPGVWRMAATILAAGAMCVVAVGLAGVVEAIFRALNLDTSDTKRLMERHIREATRHGWWAAYLTIGALPAVMEELAFRGFVLSGMRRSFGPWRGAVYATLLFAILHLVGQQIVVVFFLGLHFAALAILTRSIFASMTAHLINNCFVLTLFRAAGNADPERIRQAQESISPAMEGAGGTVIVATGLIFYAAAVLWLAYLHRRSQAEPPILRAA